VSAPEIQEVVTGLSGKPDKLYSDGLHVGGERFVLTKAEDRSLYARKVSTLFQLGINLGAQEPCVAPGHRWRALSVPDVLILLSDRVGKALLLSKLHRQFSLLTTAME
jgi:hypothetical protein